MSPADQHAQLVVLMRQRNQLLSAQVRLGNQIKAVLRVVRPSQAGPPHGERPATRGPRDSRRAGQGSKAAQSRSADPLDYFAVDVLTRARAVVHKELLGLERQVKALVRALPIWPWAKTQRGCGEINLAQLEAGAVSTFYSRLAEYPGPAALWTRFGVGLRDGAIQRKVRAVSGGSASVAAKREQAVRFGFSPARRAMLHNLGECLMKGNKGAWKALYDERKALEMARLPEAKGKKLHAHRRALRYLEKRLLRDLWRKWRDQDVCGTQMLCVEPQSPEVASRRQDQPIDDAQASYVEPPAAAARTTVARPILARRPYARRRATEAVA